MIKYRPRVSKAANEEPNSVKMSKSEGVAQIIGEGAIAFDDGELECWCALAT